MAIRTRQQLTAWDIAEKCDDKKHLPIFMRLAKRYPEDLLRTVLSECQDMFRRKEIKKKGAYFMSVLFHKRIKQLNNR